MKDISERLIKNLMGKEDKFCIIYPQTDSKNEANNAAQSGKSEEKPAEKIDFYKAEIEPLFKDEVDFDTFSKSDFRAVKVKERVAVPKSKKLRNNHELSRSVMKSCYQRTLSGNR